MAPTDRAPRFGYAVAVFINLVILYVLNVRPGWDALSFLTDATPRVLVLVNLSLLAGIVANAVYVGADGPWVKTVGDLTTTTISLAVLVQIWRVFPFGLVAPGIRTFRAPRWARAAVRLRPVDGGGGSTGPPPPFGRCQCASLRRLLMSARTTSSAVTATS